MQSNEVIYDVVIVGAGLSGIGAAYHVQHECPGKTFTVLEGRDCMGGTWDLFRYPGIRSDSDMFTLGFSFNPWQNPKAIADGPAILQYIKDTAAKFGIDKKIQYNQRVTDASWSDEEKYWTLSIAQHPAITQQKIKCRFILMCSGYYNYSNGYLPQFAGYNDFKGQIIHPQKWTADIAYEDKKVIVIGSGATAVTLVPELAKKAAGVVMLQRTPTYYLIIPGTDKIAGLLQKLLPAKMAYGISRWKNILLGIAAYKAMRRWPQTFRRLLQKGVQKELGDKYQLKDFDPPYKPWDQRLCLTPDSDLFKSLKSGKAKILTGQIERFTQHGILLKSGEEVEADLIVTATGLQLQLLGGMTIHINGSLYDAGKAHAYRGVMLSNIPNFAFTVGYTNASWTLKCDLSCRFVTKVLNYMHKNGYEVCIPQFDPDSFETEPLLDFNAGYVLRDLDKLPSQGSKHPWKVYQNYLRDFYALKIDRVDDKYLAYK
jgi:cation diffusion facilitator CzcD-associated flavoprotein CzcO